MIKVLLADDQSLVRAGFRMILKAEADIDVVGEAADGREAVAKAATHRPDVVLMDVRIAGDERHRGDAPDRDRRRRSARARSDDLRPRRVRLRGRFVPAPAPSCSRMRPSKQLLAAIRVAPKAARSSHRRSRGGSSSSSPLAATKRAVRGARRVDRR